MKKLKLKHADHVNYVKKWIMGNHKVKDVNHNGKFHHDLFFEHDKFDLVVDVHDSVEINKWGNISQREKDKILRKIVELDLEKTVSDKLLKKYVIFTDSDMFLEYKKDEHVAEFASIKLDVINFPVFPNLNREISNLIKNKELTTGGIIGALKLGFLKYDKLPQSLETDDKEIDVQAEILRILKKKSLIVSKKTETTK